MDLVAQVHSLFRWVVLAVGLAGLAAALSGRTPRPLGVIWVGVLDLQLVLGLLLFFLGSATEALPHSAVMLLAVASAHVARVLAKTRGESRPLAVAAYVIPLALISLGISVFL